MLELLLFALLGIIVGVFFGLLPGLHPNMIILIVPFLVQLNLPTTELIVFLVALGVSNIFLDFIPSMLFGASDDDQLAVLPAHKLLMQGNGYDAIKLAVIGGFGAVLFIVAALPAILFSIPAIYEFTRPFTYALLIFIVLVMILSESGVKKITAAVCFAMAGAIGLLSSQLPVDRTFLLFPILSGLFGVSIMLFTANGKIKIPKQKGEIIVSGRLQRRSVIFGSIGGIVSGLFPGVGSSEIASLATVDKNEKSFIITIGAISVSNMLMSLMALFLIAKSRSGIAVALGQLTTIGFNEFLLIIAVAIFVAAVSALITLSVAKKTIRLMERINYSLISRAIIVLITVLVFIFTGFYGLLLLATCTALGVFANLAGVRRGVLMGVLILPTIMFYLPF